MVLGLKPPIENFKTSSYKHVIAKDRSTTRGQGHAPQRNLKTQFDTEQERQRNIKVIHT